jgi:hypothetical protein
MVGSKRGDAELNVRRNGTPRMGPSAAPHSWAVLSERSDHNQVARFISPTIGPIPVMQVPIRRQTSICLWIQVPAALHDVGRFGKEASEAPQLSGIVRDDGHLAQLPRHPVSMVGLPAVIAP